MNTLKPKGFLPRNFDERLSQKTKTLEKIPTKRSFPPLNPQIGHPEPKIFQMPTQSSSVTSESTAEFSARRVTKQMKAKSQILPVLKPSNRAQVKPPIQTLLKNAKSLSESTTDPRSITASTVNSTSAGETKSFRIKSTTPVQNARIGLKPITPIKIGGQAPRNIEERKSCEAGLNNVKGCEMSRMYFNLTSQSRMKLPILIVHFEGIIGSCLIHNKEVKDNNNQKNGANNYMFIKKDVKSELKLLSKNFLIIVVFPSLNIKYKEVIKHFINYKFSFDGAYYRSSGPERATSSEISHYILDYEVILKDFKITHSNKKIFLLLPLNLNHSVIKRKCIQTNNEVKVASEFPHEKSSFLGLFPKIPIKSNNLKIIFVPNFLLDERNENYLHLFQAKFSPVTKLLNKLVLPQNLTARDPPHGDQTAKTCPDYNNEEKKGKENVNEAVREATPHSEGRLVDLELSSFVNELQRKMQHHQKLKQIQAMKAKNNTNDKKNSISQQLESGSICERIKGSIQRDSNFMDNGENNVIINDLFNCNTYMFKLYEKDNFYTSKNLYQNIVDISKFLENENPELHGKIYRIKKERKQSNLNWEDENKNTTHEKRENEEDHDKLGLDFIQKLISSIQVFLES